MPGHLAQGYRVGGRYLLEAELGQGSVSTVWRAFDDRLERRVAVRLYDPELDRSLLEDRTGLAASLTHPRVVRIFDSGVEAGHFYTVSELLPGSLAWARLPLEPDEAARIADQIAEALEHAHQRGIAHGGLHPGNVLLSEQGVKVSDFSLAGRSLDGLPAMPQDLRDLGRLLYLVLTGSGSRPLPDRPRGLAAIVHKLREGAYPAAVHVRSELRALGPRETDESRPRVVPILAGVVVVLLAVVVFGATRLGDRPGNPPAPSPGTRIIGTPLTIATVQDFDPLGDERENRATVETIYDGDPQTFWSTERYRASPDFSGLKEGVGVIFDLGEPSEVGKAQILFATPGCSYEIRYSTSRSRRVEDWETAASAADTSATSGIEFPAAESRWWLLWITGLTESVPGARGAFACAVAEVDLYAP